MTDELPKLIAAVGIEEARDLEEASRLGRHISVSLKWAPAEQGPHLLEIYTPVSNEPSLRLLAEPLGLAAVVTARSGPAGEHTLRVYPWEDDSRQSTENAVAYSAEVAPDSIVGRKIAGGRFEIISVVGEGSIGAVYRARHMGLGIVVAVKVLHEAFQRDAEFSRRFYAEALALSRLDHPNLVHIYDFGKEQGDGLLYISMAFVDGQTLRTILNHDKKLEPKRVIAIMLQVCAGLAHAHGRGLIHRDVKQDNVMIVRKEDDDGVAVENVKVLDFGFAIPPSASVDVAQRLAGTPVYMSPEQCRGKELDARSDVYACGIMIFELLTGRVPFLARDAATIRKMHVKAKPPLLSTKIPDIDPRLELLVARALAKAPEERQQNMQELRSELKAILLPEGAAGARTSGTFEKKSMPSMPVAQAAPPATAPTGKRVSAAPPSDWMENPADEYARFMGAEGQHSTPAHTIADLLATDAKAAGTWMGDFVRERDKKAFAKKLHELDGAIRILAHRGDARTLQMVAVVVSELFATTLPDDTVRDGLGAVRRLFLDPELLAPIARQLLVTQDEEARVAGTDILSTAHVQGAFALYNTRTKIAADGHVRIAFVRTMKSLGESALPVVRAALERIYENAVTGENQAGTELAEDLLLSVPKVLDEVAGHLVMRYVASPVANLCRAAARALPRVWGDRSRDVLFQLLEHEDESVRLAALVGLREIATIDAEVVEKIASLIERGLVRTPQMRAAILGAVQEATSSAYSAAVAVLESLKNE